MKWGGAYPEMAGFMVLSRGGGHEKAIFLKKLLGEDIENSKVLCFSWNHLFILAKKLGSSEAV